MKAILNITKTDTGTYEVFNDKISYTMTNHLPDAILKYASVYNDKDTRYKVRLSLHRDDTVTIVDNFMECVVGQQHIDIFTADKKLKELRK